MTDSSIARVTGMFGVACVLLSWAQFPLWVIGGAPPFYDSEALARHLYDTRTTAFIRILMDQGIYVSLMIFAAGFRHLVRRARPESDWLGLLALVSAVVWLAVTLAADGLMGGAVLATLQGTSDVSAALPLVFGTLLIYNGSIAFAITGLFMAAAGWATLDSGVLPRWTGWIAWISAVLCALSIPAMFAGPADASGFYNPGGWGPAIIANFPPVDLVPCRRCHPDSPKSIDELTPGFTLRQRFRRPPYDARLANKARARRHRAPRRMRNGVWPVRLRRTLTKWEASENPARRPISAVVRRSKSGD